MVKTPTTKTTKEPRTVKLTTVGITVLVLAFMALSFAAGWVAKTDDQVRVSSEASALVEKLKSQSR